MRVTKQDKQEFQGYLDACTDAQVWGVYDHEKKNRRRVYTEMARLELAKRGLDGSVPY